MRGARMWLRLAKARLAMFLRLRCSNRWQRGCRHLHGCLLFVISSTPLMMMEGRGGGGLHGARAMDRSRCGLAMQTDNLP
ncbi:Extradiol_Dioxygenase_3B_like domain-containing protein [Histoplasma ohiense]|nr:Extradiol_Dioxygenase_3B_like domain-containing protein [Histoplasma ohiense (nom. inval.)]